MPNYKVNDPKGWCGDPARGAALGRPTIKEEARTFKGRLYLREVRIDFQGYDPNGTYFGLGNRLYWCANNNHSVDFMLRGEDRAAARKLVLEQYPSAKVKR